MKTAILLSVLLASCHPVQAQEKYIQIEPTVQIVLTDEPCSEAKLSKAYAVETVLEEYATGCWYRANGEVMVRLKNGNHFYDYRYLESSFNDVK